MPLVDSISPEKLLHPADGTLPYFAQYKYKFLAQGDSWFSIGSVPPSATTSIIMSLNLKATACAVNCAHPGQVLKRMISATRDPNFTQLLVGNQAWQWDGILMSAGGNDLIDAVQVMPPMATTIRFKASRFRRVCGFFCGKTNGAKAPAQAAISVMQAGPRFQIT